jgi:hypothetical protein
MTSLLPKILTGTVTPGSIVSEAPFYPYKALPTSVAYSYTTDKPFGKPTHFIAPPVQQMVPKQTGDERNSNPLMKVLQQAMQKQSVGGQSEPMAKAQEQYRDWR